MVNKIHVAEDILSVFIVEVGDTPKAVSFQGTGFLISSKLLISCWHCLNDKLLPSQRYAAVIQKKSSFKFALLDEIEQDKNKSDLAFAKVQLDPVFNFKLADDEPLVGSEVFTYGFPLTEKIERADGSCQFQVNSRYLRSYITRIFNHKHHSYGTVKAYELGMPAPEGLSGAPLININDRKIVGVVFGNIDVGTIDQFSRIDPVTGEKEPEIQRIVSYGLAHHLTSIHEMTGTATNDMPLKKHLDSIAGV